MVTGLLDKDTLNLIYDGKNQQVFTWPSDLLSIIIVESCTKTTAFSDTYAEGWFDCRDVLSRSPVAD